jgi:hypothetical protein
MVNSMVSSSVALKQVSIPLAQEVRESPRKSARTTGACKKFQKRSYWMMSANPTVALAVAITTPIRAWPQEYRQGHGCDAIGLGANDSE